MLDRRSADAERAIDNLRKWERQEKLERAEEAAAEIAAGDDGPGLVQLMKPAQSA